MRPLATRVARPYPLVSESSNSDRLDFTRPLRMQHRGRSRAGCRLARWKRQMLLQALREKRTWRTGIAISLIAGAAQLTMVDPTACESWLLLLVTALTSVFSLAWARMTMQVEGFRPEHN